MSVLAKLKWVLPALMLAGLAFCHRGSAEYRHIKTLPWSEWDRYAASLPLERQIDLHKELKERSGHNGIGIDTAFIAYPAATYRSIVYRIQHGDRSIYYSDIIFSIDGEGGFEICSQPDRKVVQEYLYEMTGYPEISSGPEPRFFSC